MGAKILLLILVVVLCFEVVIAISGPNSSWGILYLTKVYLGMINILCIPFTIAIFLFAISRERGWKDKTLWGFFIVITQVVGAAFYLIWRHRGRLVQNAPT
jgi:ABC-type tungstate transport system substrate-binding protein